MSISEKALFDVGCYVKIIGVKVGLNAKIRVCFETLRHHLFFREAQKSKNNFNNTHQSLPFTETHRRNITKNDRTKGHYFSYGKILRMNLIVRVYSILNTIFSKIFDLRVKITDIFT